MYSRCTAAAAAAAAAVYSPRRRSVQKLGYSDHDGLNVKLQYYSLIIHTSSQLRRKTLQYRRGAGTQRGVGRNASSYQVHDALHSTKGECFSICYTVRL